MDVEDLMVGDLVNVSGKSVKITKDDLATMLIFLDDDSKIDPIPLTSDILVKNGFDKDERSKYFHVYTLNINGSYDFDICWSSVNGFSYEGDCMLTYVHQLQHLLRLAGIEKEIVID